MVVLSKPVILAYVGSHYALFVSAKLRKKWDLSVILRLHSPKIVNAGGVEPKECSQLFCGRGREFR